MQIYSFDFLGTETSDQLPRHFGCAAAVRWWCGLLGTVARLYK